jgi:hypothetical protein
MSRRTGTNRLLVCVWIGTAEVLGREVLLGQLKADQEAIPGVEIHVGTTYGTTEDFGYYCREPISVARP